MTGVIFRHAGLLSRRACARGIGTSLVFGRTRGAERREALYGSALAARARRSRRAHPAALRGGVSRKRTLPLVPGPRLRTRGFRSAPSSELLAHRSVVPVGRGPGPSECAKCVSPRPQTRRIPLRCKDASRQRPSRAGLILFRIIFLSEVWRAENNEPLISLIVFWRSADEKDDAATAIQSIYRSRHAIRSRTRADLHPLPHRSHGDEALHAQTNSVRPASNAAMDAAGFPSGVRNSYQQDRERWLAIDGKRSKRIGLQNAS